MFPNVFVLAGLMLFVPRSDRDFSAEIARLASPVASERAAAGRSLAARLTAGDQSLIEARVRIADTEERARWIEILSSEDKLALVGATFAASADEVVAGVGRAALAESILRWSPTAHEPGITAGELADAMNAWTQARIEIDVQLAMSPLEDVLDLVTRAAPGQIGIAVDRDYDAASRAKTGAVIVGSFTSTLRELALRHDLELVGFSCAEDDSPSARWLALVTKSGASDASDARPRERRARRVSAVGLDSRVTSALELLRSWSMTFAAPGDALGRSAAARAIAASGWPTGIALLAQSFARNGDAAALDGLMLAAGRGRVAPQLNSAAGGVALREVVARGLDSNDARRAIRAALALGASGSRGLAGEDLSSIELDDCATLNGTALFARLVEIDARRANDAGTRTALDVVLARTEAPIGARFLALEIRARFSRPIDGLVRAEDFVAFATRSGRLNDLARWLRDARSFPPETWRDTSGVPADWTFAMRAFVVGAWLARGETTTAVEHVVRALATADAVESETLAGAIRDVARTADPSAADALFAQLDVRTDIERTRLVRFIALAGGVSTEALTDEVLASVAQPATTREDWLVLGALAGTTRGPRARTRLVEGLSSTAEIADITAGLARAIEALRAKRDFELERAFENDVRTSAGGTSPRLRGQLRSGRWPAPPAAERARLADWDRSAARYGL
ncbi:MAG: hypothetical protein SGI72_01660 [Planctomycetota bacterium]|nr:hypothetical protein [Planctomycetota bacterium]